MESEYALLESEMSLPARTADSKMTRSAPYESPTSGGPERDERCLLEGENLSLLTENLWVFMLSIDDVPSA